MATLRQFTSAFTYTGANLGEGASAQRENRDLFETAPFLARKLKPLIILHHRIRRLLGGMYFQKPFDYEIFTSKSPAQRQKFHVEHPTGVYKPLSDTK